MEQRQRQNRDGAELDTELDRQIRIYKSRLGNAKDASAMLWNTIYDFLSKLHNDKYTANPLILHIVSLHFSRAEINASALP